MPLKIEMLGRARAQKNEKTERIRYTTHIDNNLTFCLWFQPIVYVAFFIRNVIYTVPFRFATE